MISFAAAPILGRLFPPSAYGTLNVLSTIVSILAAFSTLGYVSAIPMAGSPVEFRSLFVLCLILTAFTTGIVAVGSYFSANFLASSFHQSDVGQYVVFLPLMFLAGGMQQLLSTTLSYQQCFGAIAFRGVLEACVTRVVQLASYYAGLLSSPVALLLGSLCGTVVSGAAFASTALRGLCPLAERSLRLEDLREVAAKHKDFPCFQFWSATINALTVGLPSVLLARRFSLETVGFYGMAFSMVNLSVQLFTNSSTQVFYVEAAKCAASGRSAAHSAQHLVKILSLLTAFPLAVVFVLGPLIFELFLGSRWHEAGVFVQILFPWMAIVSIGSPLSSAFLICRRQAESFAWNMMLLTVRFLALYVGGIYLGVRATLAIFVWVSLIVLVSLTIRSTILLGVKPSFVIITAARAYSEAFLLLAPSAILYWVYGAKVGSLLALVCACKVHLAVIVLRHPKHRSRLLSKLSIAWLRKHLTTEDN